MGPSWDINTPTSFWLFLSHMLHGTGIFTKPFLIVQVAVFTFHVGKYSTPMEHVGLEISSLQVA